MAGHEIIIQGSSYQIDLLQKYNEDSSVPRLVIISYLPNKEAQRILQTALRAIEVFTPGKKEVWVIDNASPDEAVRWLQKQENINIVLNKTVPVLPWGFLRRLPYFKKRMSSGSFANAVGLEIASKLIDPNSKYFMSLHMDVMPTRIGWLSFMLSKLNDRVKAAGVRLDKARSPEGVLHILGCLFDWQLFQQLNVSFLPALPEFDVGDKITTEFRAAGYGVYACPNTIWNPRLADDLSASSPFKNFNVDRSFDDEGDVIFLHLGRGIKKSSSNRSSSYKVDAEKWIEFGEQLLKDG
ncbi:MAG: hypothetical protein Q8P73_01280 [bacterium]|nr:hypothetical protein [bacterium]